MKFKIVYDRYMILYVMHDDSEMFNLRDTEDIFVGTVYDALEFFENKRYNTTLLERLIVQNNF